MSSVAKLKFLFLVLSLKPLVRSFFTLLLNQKLCVCSSHHPHILLFGSQESLSVTFSLTLISKCVLSIGGMASKLSVSSC